MYIIKDKHFTREYFLIFRCLHFSPTLNLIYNVFEVICHRYQQISNNITSFKLVISLYCVPSCLSPPLCFSFSFITYITSVTCMFYNILYRPCTFEFFISLHIFDLVIIHTNINFVCIFRFEMNLKYRLKLLTWKKIIFLAFVWILLVVLPSVLCLSVFIFFVIQFFAILSLFLLVWSTLTCSQFTQTGIYSSRKEDQLKRISQSKVLSTNKDERDIAIIERH